PTRNLATGDRTGFFPTLSQYPRLGPSHDERIVGLADRPHEVLSRELLPVRKRAPAREWVHEPRARQAVLVFSVLAPVVHDVRERVPCAPRRGDRLGEIAICKHAPTTATIATLTKQRIDIPCHRDLKSLQAARERLLALRL